MTITKINNVFSEEELAILNSVTNDAYIPIVDRKYISAHENMGTGVDEVLGRLQIGNLSRTPKNIIDKVTQIANDSSDVPLAMDHVLYVEYNGKYGSPNLPPHFDGDTNDLIINYQLSANTTWGIGLNTEIYYLEDNSAVVFNGNTSVHWRPRKVFNDGEYVKMLFFRFYNTIKRSDYSHLRYNQHDDIFKDVLEYRDSLDSTL